MPGALVDALDLAFVRRAGGMLAGEHRASGVGSGTELAQLRPYQPGDDVRQLDSAATARTGIPHVRQQVPERLLTTWLAVDVSASMAFGTADRLKSDVAEGVVDVIGSLAVRRGGKVGLLTYGAPVARLLPPRGGRGARVGLRQALAEGVASDGTEGEPLERTALRIGRLTRMPSLVVIISDFAGPPIGRGAAALGAPRRRAGRTPHRAGHRGGRPAGADASRRGPPGDGRSRDRRAGGGRHAQREAAGVVRRGGRRAAPCRGRRRCAGPAPST